MGDREDLSAHERMTRVVALAIGSSGTLFLLITNPPIPAQLPLASWWWNGLALTTMALPALVLALGAFRLRLRWLMLSARVLALGQLATMALIPLGLTRNAYANDTWPWVLAITATCFVAAAFGWSFKSLAWYLPLFATFFTVAQFWSIDGREFLHFARSVAGVTTLGFVFTAVAVAAQAGSAAVDVETARLRREASARTEAETAVIERARVDGLVHDHVLAALLAAGQTSVGQRGVGEAAVQALRTMTDLANPSDRGELITAAEASARLRQLSTELDDTVAVAVHSAQHDALVSATAVQALQDVTAEALRNSLRHAGEGVTRSVDISIGATMAVVVRDNGVGFDPASVSPKRLGIAVVMRGRISGLPGAKLSIDSSPGAGTVVSASVPAQAIGEARTRTHENHGPLVQMRTVPQLFGLHTRVAAVVAMAYIVAEACRPFELVRSGVVSAEYIAAISALVVCTIILLRPSPDPMPRSSAWALAGCAVVASIFNVAAIDDFPTVSPALLWVWSPATLLLAFMPVRGRFTAAWVGQAGMTAVYTTWFFQNEIPFYGNFFFHAMWNLMLLAVCALFARSGRRQIEDASTTRAQTVALSAERGRSQALLRERDDQLRYLDETARPLLERLAQFPDVSGKLQAQAILVEARLRDRIRARALASEPVLDAAEAARTRGVDVTLLDDGALESAAVDLLAAVHATVIDHLDATTSGRVVARVMPPGRQTVCTIARTDGRQDIFTEIPSS